MNFNRFKHTMSQKSWAASHNMWLGIHQLDELRDKQTGKKQKGGEKAAKKKVK